MAIILSANAQNSIAEIAAIACILPRKAKERETAKSRVGNTNNN